MRAIPVLHFPDGKETDQKLRFSFQNLTGRPFRYIGPRTPADFHFLLYKDGKSVNPSETWCRGGVSKSDVRSIKPGQALQADFHLGWYSKLVAGRYELVSFYCVAKTNSAVKEYGLTPLQFIRPTMILDVGAAASAKSIKRIFANVDKTTRYYRDLYQMPDNLPPAGLRPLLTATAQSPSSKARFRFGFQNVAGKPLRYMQGRGGPETCDGMQLSLFQNGKPVSSHAPKLKPVAHARGGVQTLKTNECFQAELLMENYRKLNPGRYEVRAAYDMPKDHPSVKKFGLSPLHFKQTIMYLDLVEPLPDKLANAKHHRFRRVYDLDGNGRIAASYRMAADIGLGPTWNKKATLFFVVRASDIGKTKLKDRPESVLQPLRVDPKSTIRTMVHNPFPNSDDSVIEVHVLVTEPDKTQHYFLVDLTETGNPKLPTLKNKQTLKPGTRYKLQRKSFRPVELVPAGTR